MFLCSRLNQLFSVSDSLLGQVLVPFDLVKKHPKGQRTFELVTKDVVTGSLTTDVRPKKLIFYRMFSFNHQISMNSFHVSLVFIYT